MDKAGAITPPDRIATESPSAPHPSLTVQNISKTYGAVRALVSASFELAPSEVHALVGENGSGKSTAVGIISGTVRPDSGTVVVGGRQCVHHTPWESQRAGALTVFQDGSVLTDLTVAQNLYLGTPVAQRPAYRGVEQWAADRLREFGLEHLPAAASAHDLSPAERQLLEIARALMSRPTVLLLDEATSALDPAGVDVALALMRKAADSGCAVLFVTHRLSEVFRVADRISVLRDGVWQGTFPVADISAPDLVELMAGTSVDVEFPGRALPEQIGEPILVAEELCSPGCGPIDLTVRRGEIVGIAGADGNGQVDLLRGLAAIDAPRGRLRVEGRHIASFQDANGAGVAFLSSDRRSESLFPSLAIRENLVAGGLRLLSTAGVVRRRRERSQVRDSISQFGIRLGSPEDPVTSLSGGNQQKVALGRVLATDPAILLVEEPTQGVDVRSRLDIYHMLRDSARRGLAVVFVSSDASELAGLCDRVVVVSRGVVVAELSGEKATEEGIVRAFATDESARERAEAEQATVPVARVRRFARAHRDSLRLLLVAAMLVALALYAQSRNDTFLTKPSLYNVMLLTLPLAAVAAAQFVAMFAGGIDVSVGATMGVTVALLSFVVQTSGVVLGLAIAVGVAIGLGAVVGTANAAIVEKLRISPVIATIATLGILQGIGLILRPQAAGAISPKVTEALTRQVSIFPIALIVVAVLFVVADVALRSSGSGLRLRAVGLNPRFAYRLGVNASRLRQLSYIGCGILAALAGVLLAGQVGVGDSTVGNEFTLLAIAAPILGGASLLGGRGTFVGCLLGAVLIAMAQTLPTVLSLSDGASFLLTGGLTLLALLIYTRDASSAVQVYGRTAWRRIKSIHRPWVTDSAGTSTG